MTEHIVSTSYLSPVLNPDNIREAVGDIINAMDEIEFVSPFDAVAVQGMSGALMAGVISHETEKHIILVRKGHNHHSTALVEGLQRTDKKFFNYIIVDDCIETGTTVANILKQVEGFTNGAGICVGILLYAEGRDYNEIWEEIEIADQNDGTDNAKVIECLGGGKTAITTID